MTRSGVSFGVGFDILALALALISLGEGYKVYVVCRERERGREKEEKKVEGRLVIKTTENQEERDLATARCFLILGLFLEVFIFFLPQQYIFNPPTLIQTFSTAIFSSFLSLFFLSESRIEIEYINLKAHLLHPRPPPFPSPPLVQSCS